MRRDAFSMPLDLGRELIIDNFAGGGGTSTGLEAAFGRPVDIAINHDPEALAMHALNHLMLGAMELICSTTGPRFAPLRMRWRP